MQPNFLDKPPEISFGAISNSLFVCIDQNIAPEYAPDFLHRNLILART